MEKFWFRPPQDALAFGLKAYDMTDGTKTGERAARYLVNDLGDGNDNIIFDFFTLMLSSF